MLSRVTRPSGIRRALAIAVSVAAVACVAGAADPKPGKNDLIVPDSVSIITQPSESRKPTFPLAGVVRSVPVNEGDRVKAGTVLMRQDTDLDQKEAERLKVEAESTSRIEAAEADQKVRQIEYDRRAKAPNAYAASEIEESEAKLIEAQKSVKVAEDDHQQAKIKYEQELVRIEKMELKAPDDKPGEWIVQKVVTNVGEMADPQNHDGAIQIVKNDPLFVEVRGLTTMQVSTLKVGEKLQVRYLNDKADAWKEGEIFFIVPVAQADADRQVVKLKLPNPEGRDSGMRMQLNYPKKLRDTAPKDDAILTGGM